MIEACLRYVRERYEAEREVPSVRRILREFGIPRARFYSIFPGGLDELCTKLGLPVPERRLRATQKASDIRRSERKGLGDIYLGHCPTCGEPVRASDALQHMRHERVIEKPVVVERVVEKTLEKPVVVGEVQRVIERPVERVVREIVERRIKLGEFDELVAGVLAKEPRSSFEALAKLREELMRKGWLEA